jgi:CheY-like chemotaxis protein
MVVDDDVRNIFALTSLLEDHGMVVVAHDNGRDAVQSIEAQPDVDAVLMDIMMPEQDGIDTIREIRKIRSVRDVPIIAVTAKAMKGDREKCMEAGAWDYLSKPVDPGLLVASCVLGSGIDPFVRGETAMSDERANILIVDDRPEQLFVLRTVLEDLGQNIITATSGEMALKRVLAHDFAVILLDVNMPGIDGLEAAALIRSRKRSAHVPIIFITADYHDETHTARGYALGAVDYIASPVLPDVLRTKVKVFVDLHLYARRERRRIEAEAALAEERAARNAAERAERRSAFLAQATTALAQSLDLEATMRHVAGLVVPVLGDVAVLHLLPRDSEGSRTIIAQCDAVLSTSVAVAAVDRIEDAWLAAMVETLSPNERGVAVNCSATLKAGGPADDRA